MNNRIELLKNLQQNLIKDILDFLRLPELGLDKVESKSVETFPSINWYISNVLNEDITVLDNPSEIKIYIFPIELTKTSKDFSACEASLVAVSKNKEKEEMLCRWLSNYFYFIAGSVSWHARCYSYYDGGIGYLLCNKGERCSQFNFCWKLVEGYEYKPVIEWYKELLAKNNEETNTRKTILDSIINQEKLIPLNLL